MNDKKTFLSVNSVSKDFLGQKMFPEKKMHQIRHWEHLSTYQFALVIQTFYLTLETITIGILTKASKGF